jgi:hypothetical protein
MLKNVKKIIIKEEILGLDPSMHGSSMVSCRKHKIRSQSTMSESQLCDIGRATLPYVPPLSTFL